MKNQNQNQKKYKINTDHFIFSNNKIVFYKIFNISFKINFIIDYIKTKQ